MNYFKISILTFVLISLTIIRGQQYFYEAPELVREGRRVEALERNEEGVERSARYRRDDENPRHRRQGSHGNGGHGNGGHEGITGPVHTFVKTDEHAHFKWGVRHHVGHEYAGRR